MPSLQFLRYRRTVVPGGVHQQNYQQSPKQGTSVAKRWVPLAAGTIPLVDALAPVPALPPNRGTRSSPAKLPEQPQARHLGGKEVGPSRSGDDTTGGCPSSSSCATAQQNYQSSPKQGTSVAKRWVPPAAGTIPLVHALAPVPALPPNRG